MINMEYGIWLHSEKLNTYRTMGICRHHGLQEMRISNIINHKRIELHKRCLVCERLQRYGNKTGNIPGCSNYTGIHIAENVLSKAFDVMERAHPHASYDFICGKELKIDSKCSILSKSGKHLQWGFHIRQNLIPDAFCLIVLDNTSKDVYIDPKVKYVWLIPSNAIINGKKLNNMWKLTILPNTINRIEKYRRTDMEGKIIKCCDKLK